MKSILKTSAALAVVLAANSAFGVSLTVDKTGILNPNPSNLAIQEVGNTSLATARTLIAAANLANTGGVLDFQQQNQGGTFINSTLPNNGVDIGNGAANPIYVTAATGPGTFGPGLVGTPFFSLYRLEGDVAATSALDSNLDQGGNVISGGYLTRYPGTAGSNPAYPTLGDGNTVTGINPAYAPGITGSIGGGYFGIAGVASPATLVFSNPLSFFGLTGLPRGATRNTTITVTLRDLVTNAISTATIDDANNVDADGNAAATTVGASAVFFGYTAPTGFGVTQAAITNPNGAGQNRYDDLAFIIAPAVPEPTSIAALVGAAGLLGRRRRSI